MKKVVTEDAKAMELMSQKQQLQELSVKELDEQLLAEGEEFNLYVCIQRAKAAINDTGRAFAVLGANLRLMKAHLSHGEFEEVLENLNCSPRTARYAMAASRKFPNLQALADFPRATLVALTVLDDEQAAELDETGELEGVGTVDEIKQMTYRELQSALREEKKKRKEERDAQEEAISQKEKKLNELEQELRYRQPPTKEDIAQAKLDEKRKPLFTAIMSGIEDLSVAIDRVEDICRTDDVQLDQLTRLARSFDSEMSLLKEKLDTLDEALNAACPIKEDVPCMSNTPNK